LHWTEDTPLPEPGDVVVEAFGCDPPEAFVARMAAADRPPVWINLEYLSAEDYVERSHRLRSPQRCGLDKWFFYPGFTRPPAACCARMACWPSRPASTPRLAGRPGHRAAPRRAPGQPVLLPAGSLPALLAALADAPTLLLTAPARPPR
jgi:hypothetical protein